jgi:hypothetical protein
MRAVRRRETVRCSDDHSRRRVKNVRGHSSVDFAVICPAAKSLPRGRLRIGANCALQFALANIALPPALARSNNCSRPTNRDDRRRARNLPFREIRKCKEPTRGRTGRGNRDVEGFHPASHCAGTNGETRLRRREETHRRGAGRDRGSDGLNTKAERHEHEACYAARLTPDSTHQPDRIRLGSRRWKRDLATRQKLKRSPMVGRRGML